jgi:hypothetical protein
MPQPQLFARQFCPEMVADLGSFTCGKDRWGLLAEQWIRCSEPKNSAITSMAKGTSVWLYYLEEGGQLVGFGSLGPTNNKLATDRPAAFIPQLGLHIDFRGYPPGADPQDRLSSQIIGNLLLRAREQNYKSVALFVHAENFGAIKLYKRSGFIEVASVKDGYKMMAVKIIGDAGDS